MVCGQSHLTLPMPVAAAACTTPKLPACLLLLPSSPATVAVSYRCCFLLFLLSMVPPPPGVLDGDIKQRFPAITWGQVKLIHLVVSNVLGGDTA
jgi:hypothetical protein